MIAAARVLGGAAAGAALLIAGATVEPVSAQGDACKTEYVTASGRGKFRPFTKTKELEGRGSAMTDAVTTWEREVSSTLGDRWKKWDEAKDKTFECAPTKSGKIIGSSFIGCTIKGRPCAVEPPSSGEQTVASADRGRARDRDDDNDRSSRYGGYSWRYRHEMRRQEGLTQWRSRREESAFEREEARQRWLREQRDRTERIARERAETRERYFARERD
ncbi:MAG: hypothetical protein ACREF4_16250 [Gammaproteobacteria bacterium]